MPATKSALKFWIAAFENFEPRSEAPPEEGILSPEDVAAAEIEYMRQQERSKKIAAKKAGKQGALDSVNTSNFNG